VRVRSPCHTRAIDLPRNSSGSDRTPGCGASDTGNFYTAGQQLLHGRTASSTRTATLDTTSSSAVSRKTPKSLSNAAWHSRCYIGGEPNGLQG